MSRVVSWETPAGAQHTISSRKGCVVHHNHTKKLATHVGSGLSSAIRYRATVLRIAFESGHPIREFVNSRPIQPPQTAPKTRRKFSPRMSLVSAAEKSRASSAPAMFPASAKPAMPDGKIQGGFGM